MKPINIELNNAGNVRIDKKPDFLTQGISFLIREHHNMKLQSFISLTADMSKPVVDPTTLFPNSLVFPRELFTPIVVADLMEEIAEAIEFYQSLTDFLQEAHTNGIFYFFNDPNLLPADVDCTAIGLSVLLASKKITLRKVAKVADIVLRNTNESGIMQVYLPPYGERRRIDPIVCINCLDIVALADRSKEANITEEFVFEFLSSGNYRKGTRY